ncbi:MAG: sigma 54-interacting transcriptional regulator [Syntrophales bacterium]|jgi:transcriptional regulator with GAF, ATPase, and Fis domain|nr:sigma 54-interacting transcriptional regulator [Syntrophales bacterium]
MRALQIAKNSRLAGKQISVWQSFDKSAKEIILYLAHASSPVSIDQLSSLSGASTVKILNVMEEAIKRGVVYEKEEFGKGIYFLNRIIPDILLDCSVSEEEKTQALRRLIEFYNDILSEGKEKTLVLAALYITLGNSDKDKDKDIVKNAADIIFDSRDYELAGVYYDYFLKNSPEKSLSIANVKDYLDSVLGKIVTTKHLMPLQDQVTLLSRAQQIARKYEKWEYLAKIELILGHVMQAGGQHRKAFSYIKDSQRLAQGIDDPRMFKEATLLMSEFLHWKGRFAEVVRRYEQVVENLEEFGDNAAILKAGARVGICYVRCGHVARGMGMIEAVRGKANLLNLQHVSIYADLLSMHSLFELRKISEAEFYVNRISSFSDDILGPYILMRVEMCKGYILILQGNYERSFEYLKKAVEHSRYVGWMHQNSAWNFEYLDALEKRGFIHDEWTYDSEIERILQWDDIYMKGVALRYKALRDMERSQQPVNNALADLKNSEKYLKMAGAEIELARTRIALGNIHLKRGQSKLAQSYLKKAWTLFSKIDRNLFPQDLLASMPPEQNFDLMIKRMISVNESLGTVRDMKAFLEKVLSMAMDFTMAMRSAFFIFDPIAGETLVASKNFASLLLETEQSKTIRNVVAEAARKSDELIMPGKMDNDVISDGDLLAVGINSMVCMPVKMGDNLQGYLYLDNLLGQGSFPENYSHYMRLLCSQIAVGLSNINEYEKIKEMKNRFENETIFYKREMGLANPLQTIIGTSAGIMSVLGQIQQVAPTDSLVLILGETGVGKELVAKAIHKSSSRKDGPFITVNIATLPPELIVSELFGHEKGAFTGANELHKGRFELADGGTIFLDEIGDLPLNIQVNLLRVLEESTVERLGSNKTIRLDFRVVAATNKNLFEEVSKGTFRQDLFYRLNVFPIHVPSLRERKSDVKALVNHFIEKYSKKMSRNIDPLIPEELNKLMGYQWPGNVRELEHLVERAIIFSKDGSISFSGFTYPSGSSNGTVNSPLVSLADMERNYIEKVLHSVNWKLSGPKSASSILMVKPTTLLFRMKKLGIKKPLPAEFGD